MALSVRASEDQEGFRAESVATAPLNPLQDALGDFEQKVLQKYGGELEGAEEVTKVENKLTETQFEGLYGSFRTTIGREVTSEDYLNLVEKT